MNKIEWKQLFQFDLFWFIRAGLALGIAVLVTQLSFDYLESLTYDARIRLSPTPAPSGHVALVGITRDTINTLNRNPDAEDHIELIKTILEDQPRAIVYTFSPVEVEGTLTTKTMLAQTAIEAKNLIVAVDDIILKGNEARLNLPYPYHKVPTASSPLTSDTINFAGDSVTRRLIISYDSELLLTAKLAYQFNNIQDPTAYRGSFFFKGAEQNFINYRPTGSYTIHEFINISEKRFPRGTFKDKVVFIGKDTGVEASDYVRTPYSRDPAAMSKLELYANMLDTLILNNSPVRTPYWLNLLLTGLISIIVVISVWSLKPTEGLLILLSTLVGFLLLSYFLFAGFGVWLGMTHPILTVFLCYYFFIPYRLIRENRKSWEYFQKNKLLTQVEELKNNFLSMMSHDLKTPLARIQGMADVALRDQHPLSEQQKEALQSINLSSQELSYFISSILSLSRVESEEIKLHLHSKDINALIEDIVKKYEFMAKEKNVQIITELEPIFSFKMDVDLMKQVISNLVENAIKYSQPNSKVLITTEEHDGQVYIQVADQGIGITPKELPHIFQKFYRSQEAKSSPIKGSGLGLYLAKYFIDLHKGDISVESYPSQGSTFTVKLPMQQ